MTGRLTRSIVQRSIEQAMETFDRFGIRLPPFAFWTVDDWLHKGHEADEIRDCMLGWDVTDFGLGDFRRYGRTLFTLRNGNPARQYAKPYSEKLLLNPEGQRAPAHYHRSKMEDISNRAGGVVVVQVWAPDEQGQQSDLPVRIQVDGETVSLPAGGRIRLQPGQSVALPPRTIHQFWGEEGMGITVSSEVSSVNDDRQDNVFYDRISRFPTIEEDEPRRYFLCQEYLPAK